MASALSGPVQLFQLNVENVGIIRSPACAIALTRQPA